VVVSTVNGTNKSTLESERIRVLRKRKRAHQESETGLTGPALLEMCGVEMWCGGLGEAYRWPALSSAGASLASPCFRFHIPLIEPDVRICRIRLSEKTHAIAKAIACDAVCNF
jgi:hypothetical protein